MMVLAQAGYFPNGTSATPCPCLTAMWVPQGSLGRGLLLYGQHKQLCLAELLSGPKATEGTRFAVAQVTRLRLLALWCSTAACCLLLAAETIMPMQAVDAFARIPSCGAYHARPGDNLQSRGSSLLSSCIAHQTSTLSCPAALRSSPLHAGSLCRAAEDGGQGSADACRAALPLSCAGCLRGPAGRQLPSACAEGPAPVGPRAVRTSCTGRQL